MPELLLAKIKRHISMSGPIPVAEYMHLCMADHKGGYYKSQQVIGQEGDFITAPEISQMFGELIGAWVVHVWAELGKPKCFTFIELGPGRGTLMQDMLRTAGRVSRFVDAASICLIETSERMADIQRKAMAAYDNVNWHTSITDIPDQPAIFIANEFLDVLPLRQYVKTENGWLERCVGLDDEQQLTWVLGNGRLDTDMLPVSHAAEPLGAVYEISLPREVYVENIAAHIRKNGGACLFIDYGHVASAFGDTLQAISGHQFANPLEGPGKSDLTSHVDFEALHKALRGRPITCHPVLTQGEFLLALGLLQRAGKLGSNKGKNEQAAISAAAERLALPDQMGDLFKVFCFSTLKRIWPFYDQA